MTAQSGKLNPVRITDTTFRDAHQSALATRMVTEDMEPLAAEMDQVGFFSMEVWGGATFDVATRFLNQDPWDRVRVLKRLLQRTPLQMLLRGQNLVGYRHYADDVVRAFVHQAAEVGIDIFRVFDALNDERNMEASFKAIQECGKHIQATVCYSLTERRLGGPIFNIEYFVAKARTLQDMGAHSLCIKDMAGLLAPYDAYELVKALKRALHIPVQLHTHYTSGMASMTYLKAIEAGCDVVDTALAPFALRTSQPAVEPLVVALQGTLRDTGLDLARLFRLGQKLEAIAPKYRDYLDQTRMAVIDTQVLMHQTPGGMLTNLMAQLKQADALGKLEEVFAEIPRTRAELGYPPLVTPTSQIVGIQAVNNVLFGRYKMVSQEVKDYVCGLYGRPPAPVDSQVREMVCGTDPQKGQVITCRPGDVLAPEMEKARQAVKGISDKTEDVLTCAIYPTTGLKFLRVKHGLEKPEAEKKAAPAAAPAAAAATPQPPTKPAGLRTFHVYVEDQYFRVDVAPESAARRVMPPPVRREKGEAAAEPAPTPAAAATPGALLAPMPGMVVRYEVQVGAKVKAGDPVVVFEAMKMQNVLTAATAGVVKELCLKPGDKASKGDVLAVIGGN